MPLPDDLEVKRESKPHTPIPEDTYTCQIWDLELMEGDPNAKQDWLKESRIKIHFVVLDKEYRGTMLNKMASLSFNAGSGKSYSPSTLYSLACAVIGKKLDDRVAFKPNDLIGKQCRIVVKLGEEREDGSVWETITDFMAVKEEEEAITQEEIDAIREVRKAEQETKLTKQDEKDIAETLN